MKTLTLIGSLKLKKKQNLLVFFAISKGIPGIHYSRYEGRHKLKKTSWTLDIRRTSRSRNPFTEVKIFSLLDFLSCKSQNEKKLIDLDKLLQYGFKTKAVII